MVGTGQGFLAWMRAGFFKHFFSKSSEKSLYTKNHSQHVLYDLRKTYYKYESHPWKFATARPKFVQAGINNLRKENQKKNCDENIRL